MSSCEAPAGSSGRLFHFVIIFSAIMFVMTQTAHAERWYVNANVDPAASHDGMEWETAFPELQQALAVASGEDTIWVAAGVYKPNFDPVTETYTSNRNASFEINSSLQVYGGFDGTEDFLFERAGLFQETVLSGDIGNNDGPDFLGRNDNSKTIVHINGPSNLPVKFDGFTVYGGYNDSANGQGGGIFIQRASGTMLNVYINENFADGSGGGLFNNNPLAYDNPSSPGMTFRDMFFNGNEADFGGGYYHNGLRTTLTNVEFHGNKADTSGGAIYMTAVTQDFGLITEPIIQQGTFIGNQAEEGGGIFCQSGLVESTELKVLDSFFEGNKALSIVVPDGGEEGEEATGIPAEGNGGAIASWGCELIVDETIFNLNVADHQAGAIHNFLDLANSTVTRSQFYGNTAGIQGGALFGDFGTTHILVNNTFFGNEANEHGGALYFNDTVESQVVNSVFTGNKALAGYGGAIRVGDENIWTVTNSTIVSNNSAHGGGGIYVADRQGVGEIYNSILFHNLVGSQPNQLEEEDDNFNTSVNFTNIQDFWAGPSIMILGVPPSFVELEGPDGVIGTTDDNVRLRADSAGLDAGDNNRISLAQVSFYNGLPNDLDGKFRFYDAAAPDTGLPGQGYDEIIDTGAYELIEVNFYEPGPGGAPLIDDTAIISWLAFDPNDEPTIDNLRGPQFLHVEAPASLPEDWSLCETGQFEFANQVVGVIADPENPSPNRWILILSRPLSPFSWTTLSYFPNPEVNVSAGVGIFGYLPGDVDGNGTAEPEDVNAVVQALSGEIELPFGAYSEDVNVSDLFTPLDILSTIDALNGAGVNEPSNGISLPSNLGFCPEGAGGPGPVVIINPILKHVHSSVNDEAADVASIGSNRKRISCGPVAYTLLTDVYEQILSLLGIDPDVEETEGPSGGEDPGITATELYEALSDILSICTETFIPDSLSFQGTYGMETASSCANARGNGC